MKARYSFVALVVLSLLLSGASVLFTTHEVQANNHQWCDTLTLLTSKPVAKPADPASNPSRADEYVLYRDFVTLRQRFGC